MYARLNEDVDDKEDEAECRLGNVFFVLSNSFTGIDTLLFGLDLLIVGSFHLHFLRITVGIHASGIRFLASRLFGTGTSCFLVRSGTSITGAVCIDTVALLGSFRSLWGSTVADGCTWSLAIWDKRLYECFDVADAMSDRLGSTVCRLDVSGGQKLW